MIRLYETLEAARAAREELLNTIDGYLTYIRKTIDGKFAVIHIPKDCYLSWDTLARYNLPADTLGWLDEGEPNE